MRLKLVGLSLPLLLLLPGAPVAAADESCTITSVLFDSSGDQCVVGLEDSRTVALKDAQKAWDDFADRFGKAAATTWLGKRPATVNDIWWIIP